MRLLYQGRAARAGLAVANAALVPILVAINEHESVGTFLVQSATNADARLDFRYGGGGHSSSKNNGSSDDDDIVGGGGVRHQMPLEVGA